LRSEFVRKKYLFFMWVIHPSKDFDFKIQKLVYFYEQPAPF
jgi:hypothetical protein